MQPSGNALLNAFPSSIRNSLRLTSAEHAARDVLIDGKDTCEWVYFPQRGAVVSIVRSTESGATVETGIVGFEGFVMAQTLLAPAEPPLSDAVVQVSGSVSRGRLADLRAALDDQSARDLILAYCARFVSQVSQHAICNRLHSVEQRLAKWLLGVRDRIDSDSMDLTQEFLSHMLGVRRSGVTVAVGALALDGLLAHGRSSITIIDRDGLEKRTCECYAVLRLAKSGGGKPLAAMMQFVSPPIG
jgi:CRP-like cAMP-binding protein